MGPEHLSVFKVNLISQVAMIKKGRAEGIWDPGGGWCRALCAPRSVTSSGGSVISLLTSLKLFCPSMAVTCF